MTPILHAAALTHTEAEFLGTALTVARTRLGSFGATAFMFDSATQTHRLAWSTYDVDFIIPIQFGCDSPLAQVVAANGCVDLTSEALDRAGRQELPWSPNTRAFALAFPIRVYGVPYALFLFDFEPGSGLARPPAGVLGAVTAELQSGEFASALQRVRASQARVELVRAAEACSGINREISQFLAKLQGAFAPAGFPEPDLLYLQLVDRRRKTIRTVRGRGLPVSFQKTSHDLDSDDIQAVVVRERKLCVIAGNHPELLDQRVHVRFRHDRYVRLFLPLFPFPFSELRVSQPELERALLDRIDWSSETNQDDKQVPDGQKYRMQTGTWRAGVRPESRLVYGTLEFGYKKHPHHEAAAPSDLSLAPFVPEYVAFCAAQAYLLSSPLYQATLDGTFDRIGRTVASATQAETTKLWVHLTPGEMCTWSYPIQNGWPNVSEEQRRHPSIPAQVAGVDFEGNRLADDIDPTAFQRLKRLRDLTREATRDVVRVALRIDDQLADPHILRAEVDDDTSVGTQWPDDTVTRLAKKAARDTGARAASYWLFQGLPARESPQETSRQRGADAEQGEDQVVWARVAPPVNRSEAPDATSSLLDERIVEAVAREKLPRYLEDQSVAVLPLELGATSTGVLALAFKAPYDFSHETQQHLEGRIDNWAQHLSLRRMANMGRFTELLRDLRQRVADARSAALEAARSNRVSHVETFARALLGASVRRLHAAGAMLTVYRQYEVSPTGDQPTERFWTWPRKLERKPEDPPESKSGRGAAERQPTYSYEFGKATTYGRRSTLCAEALQREKVLTFLCEAPEAPEVSEIRSCLMALESHADDATGLVGLERVVSQAGVGEKAVTVLVVPALARAGGPRDLVATVTVLARGAHYYERVHRELMLELGQLIAEALSQMREQDQKRFDAHHRPHLEARRQAFQDAEDIDALVGGLLRRMGNLPGANEPGGRGGAGYWGLADNAAVWLATSEQGSPKLVLRSWRGWPKNQASKNLPNATRPVLNIQEHPLLQGLKLERSDSRVRLPRQGTFPMLSFRLEGAHDNVIKEYARCMSEGLLISFPLLGDDRRLYGVVDLCRPAPFEPGEDAVVSEILEQLSAQFSREFENCLLRQGNHISKKIHQQAAELLRRFRPRPVYRTIVQIVRDELRCEFCDLFLLEAGGAMVLQASTRAPNLWDSPERFKYTIEPEDWAHSSSRPTLRRAVVGIPKERRHVSLDLQQLVADDHKQDQLVVPLLREGTESGFGARMGVLVLGGPIAQGKNNPSSTSKKGAYKSGLFNEEHLRLAAEHLSIAASRVLLAALPIEQQNGLVNQAGHSLGQPLQNLRGSITDLLLDNKRLGLDDATCRQRKVEVDRHFHRLGLTRDNLTVAAMENPDVDGRGDPFESTNLSNLIRDEVEGFKNARPGVDPLFEGPSQCIARVHRGSFRLAIANLLDNAVKYSYDDNREINVKLRDAHGKITLHVENFGVGIPRNDLERVFAPYFRSRVQDRRGPRTGTGLGLAQVKHVIEDLHGGRVTATSRATMSDAHRSPHVTVLTVELDRKTLEEKAR